MATALGRVSRRARARSRGRLAWPFARRASVAATLRHQLHLARGERVLTRVVAANGGCVAGTERGLYWCPPGAGWLRLGWEEISRLDEDRTTGELVVTAVSGGVTRRAMLPISGGGALLALAQERVAASRIVVTRIVVDGRELWVEGRRQLPTGQVHWLVRLQDGLDRDDPALRGEIDREVAELRASLGV